MPVYIAREVVIKDSTERHVGEGSIGWCLLPRQIFGNLGVNYEKPCILAKPPVFGADYNTSISRMRENTIS